MSSRQMSLRAGSALFAIVAILFSITSAASDWSIVTEYLRLSEGPANYAAAPTPSILTARSAATLGVCDTAGPIEVESTGGITVPTAYSSLNVAFANIGIAMHTGSIVIEVCGNTVETTTAMLTASGTGIGPASYTDITIRPVGGPRIIQGDVNGAIIRLQGADNVVIDGRQNGAGTARDLTVRNSNVNGATSAIWLSSVAAGNGASNNVIRNLEIAAGVTQNTQTANTFGIIMSGTAMGITTNGVDNDNNSFIANRIIRARYGILTRGTAASDLNQNPVVTDNIIGPTSFGPDEIGKAGILMQADTGAIVARNVVQFVGGDFANTTGGADRVGIGIGAETWSSNTTSATTLTSNTYTVTGNIVHDIWDQRQASAVGINLGATGGGSPTNNLVANNFIYNILSNGPTVDQAVGIGIQGGHTDRVVFNSIAMTGDMDGSGATSAGVYGSAIRVGTTASTHANLTLKNNSIYMDVNSNTSTVPYFAITLPSNTYNWGTGGADNNNYFANLSNAQMNTGGLSTTSTAPSGGSLFNTLAQWKTAFSTPQDANSIQADPLYVLNTSDLHIQFASPNQGAGASITGVTDDFDGESRSAVPDIGADELIATTLPGSLQLSTNTYSAAESTGNIVMSVTRSGGSDGGVSAQVTFTNGTATGGATCAAGIDYINLAISVNFAEGDSAPKTVNVPVCGDALDEPDESFAATLGSPTGGATIGAISSATNAITDDDAAPTITINDNAQVEGGVGTANLAFTISLSAVSGQAVTVNYATANGTATTADNDYMVASGTATILPGNLTANVVVPVIGDSKFEANEIFTVDLSGGLNYTAFGSDLQGQGTITNDDLAPTVSVNDVSVGEGDSGVSFMQFTVALSAPSGLPVSINYASANGTATAGSDYIATTGPITLASGETLIQVTVQVTGDTVPEQNETVLFDLSGGSGYTAAGSDLQGQGTILNDDSAAVVKALWVFGDSIVPHPVITPEGRARLIARSSAAGVNRLYVSVWQSAANTSGRHMREDSEVAALIAAAHAAGQEVWAAYGDPAWPAVTAGCPAGSSPVIYMNEVGAYNASRAAAEERFDGVMLDVEPGPVTEGDFQALIAHHECMRASLDPSVKLGSAISAFWDDDPVMYPPAAGGSVKPAAHHLIDLPLDQIVVMGYRDTAGTDTCPSSNGIICLDKNEIDYAASVNKAGLVVAGIETLPLPPADDNVTFAEEGNAAMDAETQIVDTYFSTSMGFGGFAIHNYNAMYLSGLPGWPTLVPTAASSTLTGRVGDASGAALSNVIVTIEGGGLSAPVSTRTNTFGNYSFADLATGHVYIITVSSRRYAFANPTRAVSVNDNVSGVDFMAADTR